MSLNGPGGPWRFWVEVKRPGGKASAAQLAWHAAERAAWGTVLVVDEVAMLAIALEGMGWPRMQVTPTPDDATEAQVQAACKQLLRYLGFTVSDMSQGYRPGGKRHGTTRQTKGIPDLYVTRRAKDER